MLSIKKVKLITILVKNEINIKFTIYKLKTFSYNKTMKRKILMIVEYNGTNFYGWQKQTGRRTVQGELEEKLFLLTKEKCTVEGSGRTDKGVHALNQVATVDISSPIPLKNFKQALNKLLSSDVVVKKVSLCKDDFHPRFDVKRKTYEYVVDISKTRRAIDYNLITYYPYNVDIERMKKASSLFIGKHNFKAFCSAHTNVTNYEREIFDFKISKHDNRIKFLITGSGFLYNMVRIIVGTLLNIEKIGEENILKAFETGDRSLTGKTMPPNGLYLKKVEYLK